MIFILLVFTITHKYHYKRKENKLYDVQKMIDPGLWGWTIYSYSMSILAGFLFILFRTLHMANDLE